MVTVNSVNSKILPPQHLVSLLDSDDLMNCEVKSSEVMSDQLKDLLSLDYNQVVSNVSNEIITGGDTEQQESNVLASDQRRIDRIIMANINGLSKTASQAGSVFGTSDLLKRK